jgi:hypothetical protein
LACEEYIIQTRKFKVSSIKSTGVSSLRTQEGIEIDLIIEHPGRKRAARGD